MASTHAALQTYDIVYEIIQHIHSGDDSSTILARVARTCRIFSDPALSLLWRRLTDLKPLLSLFSGFQKANGEGHLTTAENRGQCVFYSDHYHICGDIPDAEWARFEKYAQFVLFFDKRYPDRIDPSVFRYLVHKSNGGPLLPRLQELICGAHPLDTVLPSLASPSIRHLRVHYREHSLNQFDPRPGYPCNATISEGEFVQEPPRPAFHPTFVKSILLYTSLKSVKIESDPGTLTLSPSVMQALSTMENLTDLAVAADWLDNSSFVCGGFPKLQKLKVHGMPPGILKLLAVIDIPALSTLVVHFSETDVAGAGKCVAMACSKFASLSCIYLLAWYSNPLMDAGRRHTALECVLAPLYSLRELQHLRVDWETGDSQSFSDGDIHRMTTAWPKLRSLSIYYKFGDDDQLLRPSMNALHDLLVHCRSLESVLLPMVGIHSLQDLKEHLSASGHDVCWLQVPSTAPQPFSDADIEYDSYF